MNLKQKKKNTIDLITWLNEKDLEDLAKFIAAIEENEIRIARDIIVQEIGYDIFNRGIREDNSLDINKLKNNWEDNKEIIVDKISYLNKQPIVVKSNRDKVDTAKEYSDIIIDLVFLVFALSYIVFLTFGNIPEDNVRFADTCLGFVISILTRTFLGNLKNNSIEKKYSNNENKSQ